MSDIASADSIGLHMMKVAFIMRKAVLFLQKNDGIIFQIFRFVYSKHHQWRRMEREREQRLKRDVFRLYDLVRS